MARQLLSYCGQIVRNYDYNRFLLGLTAPPDKRAALWTLFAFNHEIARTREVVTETQLGLIRLQWWRDNIAALYEGKEPFGHPALEALSRVIKAHALPQADFDALLYAREFDLENVPPEGIAGLENYADFTTTPLHRLAEKILEQETDEKIRRAVAAGYAMTGLVRAVPFHEAQGRRFMPDGVTLPEVTARARALLAAGRGRKGFTGAAASLGLHYAGKLEKSGSDPRRSTGNAPPVPFLLKAFCGAFRPPRG